jgi:hypothetical protein
VSDAIRFYFDEHIPNAAAKALRAKGADVLTVVEAGRDTYPDEEQLRFATADARVVVTHDEDFTAWAADFLDRGEPFAGIAYSHPDKYKSDVGGLIYALELIYTAMTPDELLNHLEYL